MRRKEGFGGGGRRPGRAKSGGGEASRAETWREPERVEGRGKNTTRRGRDRAGMGQGAGPGVGTLTRAGGASRRPLGRCRGQSGLGAAALSEAHGDCVL